MKKSILEDVVEQGTSSIFKGRGLPVIALILVGASFSLSMIFLRDCMGNSHLKAAKKMYEAGDFLGAASEANICMEEEPDTLVCMDMFADAHAALVMTAQDRDSRMEHVCTALRTYVKRLQLQYFNNVATKAHLLAERNDMDIDIKKGAIYGGCTEGQTESPGPTP